MPASDDILARCRTCRWYAEQPDLFGGTTRHLCHAEETSIRRENDNGDMETVAPTVQAARASYGTCGPAAIFWRAKEPARASK